MKIDWKGHEGILKNVDAFDLTAIFESGQAFRWNWEEDHSLTVIEKRHVLNIKEQGDEIHFRNCTESEFKSVWYHYFDFKTGYDMVKKALSIDKMMLSAIDMGKGIRILNQDPFQTIINFILSANSNIPRIKDSMDRIARNYGEQIGTFNHRKYYAFPSAETLANISKEELREIAKVGYRDKSVIESAKMISSGMIDIDEITTYPTRKLKQELMKLPGVGSKVSDCIMLFAYDRKEVFPVDVWIKRMMEEHYLKEKVPKNQISEKAQEIFGEYAGFANHYLFYYGRKNQIGK